MTDVTKVLEDRAALAPAPPLDLVSRVETRYRRRRTRRAGTAAFAAVLVLAGGAWAVVGPAEHRDDPPATYAPFRVPADIGDPPPVSALPGAIVVDDFPAASPSGQPVMPVTALDSGHLLLADLDTFYRYDVRARSFTVLVRGADTRGVNTRAARGFAVTPEWLFWKVDHRSGGFSVYRAPRTGGPRERVADVNARGASMEWYADAGSLYWSIQSVPGVVRLSLADGTTERLPGFETLFVNGSPWARSRNAEGGTPVTFRHLVTGEQRTVPRPATGRLDCVPTFCLSPDGRFLQRPDGSNRTALPPSLGRPYLLQVGGSGRVLLDGGLVLDPETGELVTMHDAGNANCRYGARPAGALGVVDDWKGPGCRTPNRVVFLTDTD